jgi:hypothetical protein
MSSVCDLPRLQPPSADGANWLLSLDEASDEYEPYGTGCRRLPSLSGVIDLPAVVLIDPREQAPYAFTGFAVNINLNRPNWSRAALAVETARAAMRTGDYSLAGPDGEPLPVAVERKSRVDLLETIISRRKKFRLELERLSELDRACVCVECLADDLFKPPFPGSRMPIGAVRRELDRAQEDFPRVTWHFENGRRDGELRVLMELVLYLARRQPRG